MIDAFRLRALAAAAMGALALAAPARAFDDRPSTFAPLLGFVGIGSDDNKSADIDFRERPKLVVPKSNNLPTPVAAHRAGNWPVDPDVQRRRNALAESRQPRRIELNKNPVLSPYELQAGRNPQSGGGQELCESKNLGAGDCSAPTPIDKLRRVFSLNGDSAPSDTVTPGYEPKREFLTEPPAGYRRATAVVKATSSRPREKIDYGDPRQYYRDEAKRNNPDQ